jgi:pimeloyl-ACP methyl ester carboxylesterase
MLRLSGLGESRSRLWRWGRQASPAARTSVFLVASLLLVVPIGCASISAREGWLHNAIDDRIERFTATHYLSSATGAVLLHHGLQAKAAIDPGGTARLLEAKLQSEPEPDGPLALAELSYQAGLEAPSQPHSCALASYRDAAALAWLALSEPAGSRPDLAIRIHNGAIARLIRASQAEIGPDCRNWREVLAAQGINLQSSMPYLGPHKIANLRVAADLRVKGMDHLYRSDGLGVPLVIHRVVARDSTSPDEQDAFLPRDLRTGATAVFMAGGGLAGSAWRQRPPTLLLLDAFEPASLSVGGNPVRLAHDHTTPIASLVDGRQFALLEWTGLFDGSFQRLGVDTGLYMYRPYDPGKIPVVFVHGLFSSPRAWAQTINELRNSPLLNSRYQFWVFLYPTGMPIPASARQLRESLLRAREAVDPGHTDAALDQMVLVGHSMGGVLSKMMAQDSGSTLWNAAITVPQDRFRSSPEIRQNLDAMLVFHPLPCVRRVVFIATPHRGSPIANGPVGWTVSLFVRRPDGLSARVAEVEALNGPNVLSRELHGHSLNAIGNLRTDSPILAALDRIPIDPAVTYHSVIPLIGSLTNTDGVVEYRSSRLTRVTSELIVAGTHFSQEAPAVTRELRRILLEHVGARESAASSDGPAVAGGVVRRTANR